MVRGDANKLDNIKKSNRNVVVLDMTTDEKIGNSLTTALIGLNVSFVGGESNASDGRVEEGTKNVSTRGIMLDYYNLDNFESVIRRLRIVMHLKM